jgi:YggT family protein
MANTLITIINVLEDLITILLFAHIILSYVMSPFHPLRQAIDKIISPMLDPIRRLIPTTGGLDFSPMALWLIIYLVANILRQLILSAY